MTLKMTEKNNHRASHPKDSASPVTFYGEGRQNGLLMMAFTTSLICHCILFSVLVYAQTHKPKRRPAPIVMNVSLVSLPEYTGPSRQVSKPSVSGEKKATTKPVPIKKAPAAEPSVAPKTVKKKVSLKKKTYKSEKVKENTLQKLEKKIETTTSDRIAKAIDEIKAKVDKEKDRAPSKESCGSKSLNRNSLGQTVRPVAENWLRSLIFIAWKLPLMYSRTGLSPNNWPMADLICRRCLYSR